jgi:alpha-tubulin suppressor-like RCC1 family protein
VALDSSGRAWSWGDNAFGELGVNASALTAGSCAQRADCSATPVLANLPANVHLTAIAAGEDYTAAVDAGGHVWAWGTNAHGALGLAGAATTCATATACTVNGPPQPTNSVPAEVSAPAGVHFVAVAVTQGDQSGDDATIALDGHGQAWAWGANLILQFSAGRQPCFSPENLPQNSATGVELCMLTPAKLNMPAGVTFEKIAASTDVLLGFPR